MRKGQDGIGERYWRLMDMGTGDWRYKTMSKVICETVQKETKGALNSKKYRPYLQKIKDDINMDLQYGRCYPVKDSQGYIIDWKGSKSFFPSWMHSIHQYGNPQNIIKGVDNVLAGNKITERMEEILRNIVADLRSEAAGELWACREQKARCLLNSA